MKRIETENFIIKEGVVDSNNDSTWIITSKNDNKSFFIHFFRSSLSINIKFFKGHYIQNSSEAIHDFCEYLCSQGFIPKITIYKNVPLIITCKKAGFRKVKDVEHLYVYKVKNNTSIET